MAAVRRTAGITLAAVWMQVMVASTGWAQGEPAWAKIPDAELEERLRALEANFAAEQRDNRLWYFGWFGTFTVLTTGAFIWAGTTDDIATRDHRLVGGVTSGLGILQMSVLGMPPAFSASRFAALPEATREEREAKLMAGERMGLAGANRQQLGRTFIPHLALAVVATVSGLVLALPLDHPREGIIQFVSGVAVGELQIWTMPQDAVAHWDAYLDRFGPPPELRAHRPNIPRTPMRWRAAVLPGMVAVGAEF